MNQNDSNSFDPRAWSVGQERASDVATNLPLGSPTPIDSNRNLFLAIAGSALILGSGIAVAWLQRDPLPQTMRTPPIAVPSKPPVEQLASKRILNLGSPLELESAMAANGVPVVDARAAAAALTKLGALVQRMAQIRAVLYLDGEGNSQALQRLEMSFLDSSGAVVSRGEDGTFHANAVAASLSTQIVMRTGEMNEVDFYSSAVTAGVIDSLIPTFAQAFVYDFNFQTEITSGDVFAAVFEQQVNASRQPVGPPRLLYASMTTRTKSRSLYRFQPNGGEEGWYDGNGRSVRRSFMRTPVEGARISSHFGMRFHPVLHYTRLHGGIDLAAPIGTPIYASAAGVITSVSPSGCAGNMVIMTHDNGWETRYFHLNNYAPDLQPGLRVGQGHVLGGVGTTGTCTTGPHLHYEVHINGEKVDPESIPTEQGERLSGEMLAAFIRERDRIDVARAAQAN